MMRSKTTISYLMLAIYALMLVHTLIPHNHCVSLWQSPTMVIYTDGADNHHRLQHQMPRHTHLKYCEYYTLPAIQADITADDVQIASLAFVIPHINSKPADAPGALITQANQASYHHILPVHCGFFTSVKLLRAPPVA